MMWLAASVLFLPLANAYRVQLVPLKIHNLTSVSEKKLPDGPSSKNISVEFPSTSGIAISPSSARTHPHRDVEQKGSPSTSGIEISQSLARTHPRRDIEQEESLRVAHPHRDFEQKEKQDTLKHLTQNSNSSFISMIQEQAWATQEVRMQSSLSFLLQVIKGGYGSYIIVGTVLIVIVCLGCSLIQLFGPSARFQHVHDGRLVYEWTQSPKVANIYLKPPEGVLEEDLDVTIESRHLRIGLKGKPFFLDEQTHDLVNVRKSSWSLEKNELHISLYKAHKAQWPAILQSKA